MPRGPVSPAQPVDAMETGDAAVTGIAAETMLNYHDVLESKNKHLKDFKICSNYRSFRRCPRNKKSSSN